METYVESFTESLNHPQFSEQVFLEDVEYDDTALEEMLHNAHQVLVYHSQREGLSVGQSSSSVSERTGRSVVERTGRPVVARGQELNVGNAQIRTLLDELLHEQFLKQNWELREAHHKSLNEMEELKKFQGSTFDKIARRRLVEDQDTILELTGKIQDL